MKALLLVMLPILSWGGVQQSSRTPVLIPSESVIRGQLLVKADGAPLAGHPVQLRVAGREPLGAVTDEQGYYEFPRVEFERAAPKVHAIYAPGIRFQVNGLPVSEMGPGPLIWVVRTRTRVLNGVALDLGLRTPLANSFIKITEPDGPSEVCKTDAQGRFVTEREYAKAALRVASWDNPDSNPGSPGSWSRLDWEPDKPDESNYVAVKVGRRFELKLPPEVSTEASSLMVLLRGAGRSLGFREYGDQALSLHQKDEGHWVRTRKLTRELRPLKTLEFLVFGEAPPRVWRGPVLEDGEIELVGVPCGALSGRISGRLGLGGESWGDSFGGDPFVSLEFVRAPTAGEEGLSFSRRVPLNADFRIPVMEPGRWRVRVHCTRFAEYMTELTISNGGETSLRSDLGLPKKRGSVTIRLAMQSGDVPALGDFRSGPDYSVRLVGEGGGVHYIETSAFCGNGISAMLKRVERDGRWVMEAVIPELPEDDYRVRVTSRESYPVMTDGIVRPGEVESVTLLPLQPLGAYGLEFPDEVAGTPKTRYYSLRSLANDPAFPLASSPMEGGIHGMNIPPSVDLSWCYFNAGFQRVYGDRDSFVPKNGGYWASITHIPGYSIRLEATLEDGSPAANLPMTFAGENFRTDPTGHVLLKTSNKRPDTKVRLASASIVSGDLDPAGRFSFVATNLRLVVRKSPN